MTLPSSSDYRVPARRRCHRSPTGLWSATTSTAGATTESSTSRGITEPTATFSTLFGAPFMALHPTVYADMFGKLISANDVECWLVNTGWTGGPYGTGRRMDIAVSRAVIRAALSGALSEVTTTTDPVFGLAVPDHCPGVPEEVLRSAIRFSLSPLLPLHDIDEAAHRIAAVVSRLRRG